MRKNHKKKNNISLILILMILGIGLGYALLSQDLTINGTTKVKGNNWSIHFDNVQISSGSVTLSTGDSAATIDSNDDTLVEYTVTLNTPGDFYEFTVDAVNDGTVDGMIGEIVSKLNNTVINTTNPVPSYLDYSVTYEDGTTIAPNHLLAANTSETYKVRVEFKRDIEETDLPTTDQTNTFSFGISYVQSDNTAIAVPHPFNGVVYSTSTTSVSIGTNINDINYYLTGEEARTALAAEWSEYYGWPENKAVPYCIKHIVANDIITENDIEFVITEEMANIDSNMTVGTYTIRGEVTGYYNYTTNRWEDLDYQVQYYENNIAILQAAFGSSNCANLGYNQDYEYSCSNSDFIIGVNVRGGIHTDSAGRAYFCEAGCDQSSYCGYE